MALTFVEGADSRQNLGFSGIIQVNTVQPASADYVTGGYLINPASFGLGEIHGMWCIGQAGAALATTFIPVFNKTSGKLQFFGAPATGQALGAALAEVANGTDLSAFKFYIMAFGF